MQEIRKKRKQIGKSRKLEKEGNKKCWKSEREILKKSTDQRINKN